MKKLSSCLIILFYFSIFIFLPKKFLLCQQIFVVFDFLFIWLFLRDILFLNINITNNFCNPNLCHRSKFSWSENILAYKTISKWYGKVGLIFAPKVSLDVPVLFSMKLPFLFHYKFFPIFLVASNIENQCLFALQLLGGYFLAIFWGQSIFRWRFFDFCCFVHFWNINREL